MFCVFCFLFFVRRFLYRVFFSPHGEKKMPSVKFVRPKPLAVAVRMPAQGGVILLGRTRYTVVRSLSTREQIDEGREAVHVRASKQDFVLKWSTVRDVLIYEANVGFACFAETQKAPKAQKAVVPEPVALFADPERDWLVQRHVAFVPLYRRVREPTFGLAEYMTRLCAALADLQRIGFVHRDMHSGNVGTVGYSNTPVLIDFGMSVARIGGAVYGADDATSVYKAAGSRDSTSPSLDMLCLTASMIPFLSSSVALAPRRMHAMLNSALSAATSHGTPSCFVEPLAADAARAFHRIAYQYSATKLIPSFVPSAFALELAAPRLDIEVAQSRSEAHAGAANNFLAIVEHLCGPVTRTRFIRASPSVGVVRVGAEGVRAVAGGRCTARTVCGDGPVELHTHLRGLVRRHGADASRALDAASCALVHCLDNDDDATSVVVFTHGANRYVLDSTRPTTHDAASLARARSESMQREAVFATMPLAWAPVAFAGLDELVASGACSILGDSIGSRAVAAFVASIGPSPLYSD